MFSQKETFRSAAKPFLIEERALKKTIPKFGKTNMTL